MAEVIQNNYTMPMTRQHIGVVLQHRTKVGAGQSSKFRTHSRMPKFIAMFLENWILL